MLANKMFRFEYTPPSLCLMSDAGDDESFAGGIDALVNKIAAEAEQPAAGAATGGDEQQNQAGGGDADPGGDGAPDEDQPSADDKDEGEEQEPADDQPLIEPPLSWSKEHKEHWAKLPRETQEYLHSREQQRDAEVRRSQNEAAETRRTIDTDKAALTQERQHYAQQLQTFIALTEALDPILAEGQRTDWAKEAAEDPAGTQQKWFAFTQRQQQLAGAVAQRDALLTQHMQTALAEEGRRLVEAVPEWAEAGPSGSFEKAKAGIESIRRGVVERYGFKPEEVAVIRDHRHALMAKDALAYHELKASVSKTQTDRAAAAKSVEQKRVASAPRLAPSPGQSQANEGRGRQANTALRKIGGDTTRNVDDRVDALLAQL